MDSTSYLCASIHSLTTKTSVLSRTYRLPTCVIQLYLRINLSLIHICDTHLLCTIINLLQFYSNHALSISCLLRPHNLIRAFSLTLVLAARFLTSLKYRLEISLQVPTRFLNCKIQQERDITAMVVIRLCAIVLSFQTYVQLFNPLGARINCGFTIVSVHLNCLLLIENKCNID